MYRTKLKMNGKILCRKKYFDLKLQPYFCTLINAEKHLQPSVADPPMDPQIKDFDNVRRLFNYDMDWNPRADPQHCFKKRQILFLHYYD